MEYKYMLVIHFKLTDMIRNEYFRTKEGMEERAKELKKYKNEILHKYEIKECE